MLMAVEDHGGGAHYIRIRLWPKLQFWSVFTVLLFLGLAAVSAFDQAWLATAVLGVIGLGFLLRGTQECAFGMGALNQAYEQFKTQVTSDPG